MNVLGDDQDLDDRVIRQLWGENQVLRDQVNRMRTNVGDQGDEGMLITYQIFAHNKKTVQRSWKMDIYCQTSLKDYLNWFFKIILLDRCIFSSKILIEMHF